MLKFWNWKTCLGKIHNGVCVSFPETWPDCLQVEPPRSGLLYVCCVGQEHLEQTRCITVSAPQVQYRFYCKMEKSAQNARKKIAQAKEADGSRWADGVEPNTYKEGESPGRRNDTSKWASSSGLLPLYLFTASETVHQCDHKQLQKQQLGTLTLLRDKPAKQWKLSEIYHEWLLCIPLHEVQNKMVRAVFGDKRPR